MTPKVSVIIPAYNQAAYIAEAIQSVVKQTYSNWELVIVDDGSTDSTARVVAQIDDPRIRYLYQANKGLPGARNTGIAHSSGEYLAFLDADDLYHPDKLAVQVAHLDQNPEIGLSYTSRIGIDQYGNPLTFYRAPEEVSLRELVLAYPFTINDLLVRRHWVEELAGFDETFLLNSEDRDFYLRLALAGCRFAGTIRFLAYRRFHSGRIFHRIPEKMTTYFRSLETAFADPRCPEKVLKLRDAAYGEVYKAWAYQALVQGETRLGRDYLRETLRLIPSLLSNRGSNLLKFLIRSSITDGGNHEVSLRTIFAQLPEEMRWLCVYCDGAIASGYLLRGIREVIWGRLEQGSFLCAKAAEFGARLDEEFIPNLANQLLSFEAEFGIEASNRVFRNLTYCMKSMQARIGLRQLRGNYSINQAFKNYYAGDYTKVPGAIMRAVSNDPRYLANRGVLAIVFRSVIQLASQTWA